MNYDQYCESICNEWNVSLGEVKSKRKYGNLADCRHCIAFCLYQNFPIGYSDVARYLNRNHSTIMHSVDKVLSTTYLMSYCKKKVEGEFKHYDTDYLDMIFCMNPNHPMGNIITYYA